MKGDVEISQSQVKYSIVYFVLIQDREETGVVVFTELSVLHFCCQLLLGLINEINAKKEMAVSDLQGTIALYYTDKKYPGLTSRMPDCCGLLQCIVE